MTLEFRCMDWKKGAIVELEGEVKATEMTGLGKPGVFLKIPGFATIPAEEFCKIVEYFLTNYDLVKDDPRLKLVEFVKGLQEVEGYNDGRRRLEYQSPDPSRN